MQLTPVQPLPGTTRPVATPAGPGGAAGAEHHGTVAMFQIDPGSHTPLYLQIAAQVTEAIVRGRLRTGDPLPSIRCVADELGLSTNTVVQAYRELVRSGVVVGRRGRGMFVASSHTEQEHATLLVQEMVRRALRLGVTADEVRRLVDTELERAGWRARP